MRAMHRRNKMKGHFMRPESQELTLRSALSDPLIRTLMAADRVDRRELEIDAAADRGTGHAKLADQSLRLLGVIASRFHARQRWRAYFAVVQTMPHRPAA